MTTSQPESPTKQSSTSQQPQQQQTQQQQPNTNPTSSQQPFNPFANLLGGLGLGQIGQPQATTITFGNMNELNQGLGGILGSLGIRIPPVSGNVAQQPQQQQPRPATTQQTHNNPFQTPPSNTNRPNQQNNQPTSVFNPIQQQPQNTQQSTTIQPQNQTLPWSVSNEPILRLNQTISTLNLPPEPVLENRHMSLR